MEIDTMVRHRLPIVVVVSNNRGWGGGRPEREQGPVASALAEDRYDRLAQALGAHGEHVTRLDQLRPALDRACESGRPAVIDVETDPGVQAERLKLIVEMRLM